MADRAAGPVVVAIAANGNEVSPHFGRCEHYVIAEVSGNQILQQRRVASPTHEPGKLPAFLHNLGAQVILAGGIGGRAQELFSGFGIHCVAGVGGNVADALAAYADGRLAAGESSCEHDAVDGKPTGDHSEGRC